MILAAAAGHRVVVVTATDGAVGEVDDGVLAHGELLAERRARELEAAAEIMGVARVVRLGYRDSGMMGTDDNDHPDCFWRADVEAAAERLAAVLDEESADVITVYDEHGAYGHPDHIQVHRVGHRAAALAATPRVYEVSMHRESLAELRDRARTAAEAAGEELDMSDLMPLDELGLPDVELTARVDVTAALETKRTAMAAHHTQIAPDSWFMTMSNDDFAFMFGTEWFRRVTPPVANGEVRETSIIGAP